MAVDGLTALPVLVERRGGELYLEVAEPVGIGDLRAVGWADPVDPELVLVGENLFLRAGRFGAFATDATLEQVAQVSRRAHREVIEAARD